MTIHIVIDRIVLHDIDLSPVERARMHDELHAALTAAIGGYADAVPWHTPHGRRVEMESLAVPCGGRAQLGRALGHAMGSHLWRGPAIASSARGVR